MSVCVNPTKVNVLFPENLRRKIYTKGTQYHFFVKYTTLNWQGKEFWSKHLIKDLSNAIPLGKLTCADNI